MGEGFDRQTVLCLHCILCTRRLLGKGRGPWGRIHPPWPITARDVESREPRIGYSLHWLLWHFVCAKRPEPAIVAADVRDRHAPVVGPLGLRPPSQRRAGHARAIGHRPCGALCEQSDMLMACVAPPSPRLRLARPSVFSARPRTVSIVQRCLSRSSFPLFPSHPPSTRLLLPPPHIPLPAHNTCRRRISTLPAHHITHTLSMVEGRLQRLPIPQPTTRESLELTAILA